MNWTFGIVTARGHAKLGLQAQKQRLVDIVESIQADVPEDNCEIIIVGDFWHIEFPQTRLIVFDEQRRPGWITRKKNMITEAAQFENIVYMHDYFKLYPGWYRGFEKFGPDWDVAMNVQINTDDTRFRDWCIWDDPEWGPPWMQYEPFCGPAGKYRAGTNRIAPYDYTKTQYMYVSGGFWVAKRRFMQQCPLDERWVWGEAEDVEWSDRMREIAVYRMNTHSAVQLMKFKDPVLKPTDPAFMEKYYFMRGLVR
jgi:hypothetical protein